MDQKIPTSFIPRTSAPGAGMPQRSAIGLLLIVSVLIFLLTLAALGGLFFYKKTLVTQQSNLQNQLKVYEEKIHSPDVEQVLALNNRLNVATDRLANHLAISHILDLLALDTLVDVRWIDFSFQLSQTGELVLTMNGQARSFGAIALQSDKITADQTNFKNPVFSNINLDGNGNPSFTLKTTINPALVSYSAPFNQSTQ